MPRLALLLLAVFALGCSSSSKPPAQLPTPPELLTDRLVDVSDHARMMFGDASFLGGDFAGAERHYRQVTGRAGSPYRTLANYKLGWLYYRRDAFEAAIGFFEAAIEGSSGNDEATLRAEAVQYIAISLTEPWTQGQLPGPADAIARGVARYGDGKKPSIAGRVFEALGDVLRDTGASPEARKSYELALAATPKESPLRAGLKLKITDLRKE